MHSVAPLQIFARILGNPMYCQQLAIPRMSTTAVQEPSANEALAHARNELKKARDALARADGHRQGECARLAIDAAATVLADPAATRREIAAAHSFLRDALELDGRPNTCGIESVDMIGEASSLPPEDRRWLKGYLLPEAIRRRRSRWHLPGSVDWTTGVPTWSPAGRRTRDTGLLGVDVDNEALKEPRREGDYR
jgi:hypothetical protein